jgi:hypothetical protein
MEIVCSNTLPRITARSWGIVGDNRLYFIEVADADRGWFAPGESFGWERSHSLVRGTRGMTCHWSNVMSMDPESDAVPRTRTHALLEVDFPDACVSNT